MSTVDIVVLALVALMALSGFRRGLLAGVLSLAGLVGGAYLGSRMGSSLLEFDQGRWLPLVALGGAAVGAALGQAVGSVLGGHVRRGLLILGPLRVLDSLGGAVLGAATGLAACWAIGAVFLYVPGQTELRRYAQESEILSRLNREFPPARLMDAISRIDPFAVLAGPEAGVDPPDAAIVSATGVVAAAPSVVRITGFACGLGIEGSGWIAAPGLVVTNAHVVAGIHRPTVDRSSGRPLRSRVVSFDRINDVAVLRVDGLRGRPLRLAEPRNGTAAALLGYPQNGPYAVTPVRVGRVVPVVGRDAYGRFPTSRVVTAIRGQVRSGNSGGPVVDASGRVLSTVFAQRVGARGGYGVPTAFVRAALQRAGSKALSTDCVDR